MSSSYEDSTFDDIEEFTGEEDSSGASRRKKGCCIALVLALLIPMLVVGAIVGSYFWGLHNTYTKNVDTVELEEKDRQAQGKGTNILLLGSDKRSPEEAEKSGVVGQRSDVIMLVHISEDNKQMYVTSFPRDLYIDIPGHGKDRINAALAYGGVPLATQTVENYVGVKIDHVALVDFDGIQKIVDTLGGVDVEVAQNFEGDGKTFTKGTQHMDGETALIFVRQRMQLADGDFERNANQRRLLAAIMKKIISADTLSDPQKVQALTEDLSPYLTVDSGLTSSTIASLAFDSRSIRSSDIRYGSVPHGGPTTTSGGASVVATDEAAMDEFRTAIKNDAMEEWHSRNH